MTSSAAVDVFEFPCSFAQQRVWIDDRLAPGMPFYNIHAAIRVPAALEPLPMQRALAALVERHETLRTSFCERNGLPLQRVASAGACDFAFEDLRLLDAASRERQVLACAHGQARQAFDLLHGPLLRVRLLRTAPVETVLMLTIHHIVADAWSMSVMLSELTALYEAAAQGRTQHLPELPIQYADYAVWERQTSDAALHDEALAWWCERLQGLPLLELPTDRPRPPVASHRGHTVLADFDTALAQRVLGFAQARATTPYVVLLAALAVVLQRNAGCDEVVVGVPVAGRDRPELEGLIGFFVNTLVLRMDLAGEPGFSALVQRVQHALHDALAHAAVPFERIIDALKPARDLSRNPLFQVSAQYLAGPGDAAGAGYSDMPSGPQLLDIQRGGVNFDLAFDFWRAASGLKARVDYATDLFDESTVRRWLDQLQRVLDQAVAQPDASVESIDLLSTAERARLLGRWAGEAAPYPRDANLALQWQVAVERHAQAVALRADGIDWCYAELDAQSACWSARLAERGVPAGGKVGVALPRGAPQVAALIGIVRLGAAYVGIDAAWPEQRLAACITAAGIAHTVCEDADVPLFARLGTVTTTPGDLPARAAERVEALPWPAIDPLAPAYVAFTSGSTGAPKGVVVPHRAVLRLVCGNPQVPLAAGDRMLVYAPLAFDASTLEIWGPLLNGGCLVIPPPQPLGLDELARWIAAEHVTVAWLTAGLFHQMAAMHAQTLARIERLFAGGDVLGSDAVRRVLAAGDGRNGVLNGYGPTENTTFTCVHAMRSAADAASPVPIGRPIANGTVRVVDGRGRLVPVGVAGELLAGGDGVALGYCGDAAASARAFVPDPFDAAGGRVYRTGDRVRWRADGALEFLGRIDRQLKVRGYRIEPGDVEAALRMLPGVADAHVLARADPSGDKRLVAYVAWNGAGTPLAAGASSPAQAKALLNQLAARLPAWMLPSELHLCAELRLNASGKIDEAALGAGAPAPGVAAPDTDPAALEGEVEPLIAQVWSDVLGRDVVDAGAGFFTDLGGHSLLATQVVSRLNAALGLALPLAAIFEEPTLRGFAARVEALLVAELEAAAQ